jgi:O-antigen/teichoic acid export membrane protein
VIAPPTARRIANNTGALFAGRLLVMVSSFLFLLSAARLLGVDGFGRYALIRAYFDVLLSISATGLSILVTREIAKNPSSTPVYFGTAVPLTVAVATSITGLLVVLSPVIGYGEEIRTPLWLACMALIPASLAVLSEAVFVANGDAHYVMWGSSAEALFYTSAALALLWLGYGVASLFVVLVATRSCLAAAYSALLWQQFGPIYRPGSWAFVKQLCRDWRVFAFENWLVSLTAGIDTIVLSMFHRETAVGFYAAALKVTNVGSPLIHSFTSAMFPYMSRLYGESRQAFRRVSEESLKYMLAVALPGVVVVAMYADQVIPTLYGDAYAEAVPVLRIVVWVFVFSFANPFLSHLLFARGEPVKSLRVAAVTFVVFLALSLLLTPGWGAVGAAWALLARYVLACFLYSAAVFRSELTRVLITFGRTSVAAASLATFLVLGRHAHPAALAAGAVGVYLGVLMLMRVSSAREFRTFFRASP